MEHLKNDIFEEIFKEMQIANEMAARSDTPNSYKEFYLGKASGIQVAINVMARWFSYHSPTGKA